MSYGRILGAPIDSGVIKQLHTRQNAHLSLNKDSQDMSFLHSKTAWVRLSSATDTATVDPNTKKHQYSSYSAKNNVLQAGTLDYTNQGKALKLREGIGGQDAAYGLHNKEYGTGFRPLPGITSANIVSQNQYGTIRSATIEFKCWDKEDLDILDRLYLRPGFEILLEWGWSIYRTNEGKYVSDPEVVPTSTYFDGHSRTAVEQKIEEIKTKSDYNYDAMFGVVKNYQISFNIDGGYDCRVDMISKGEILNELSIALGQAGKNATQVTSQLLGNEDTTKIGAGGTPKTNAVETSVKNYYTLITEVLGVYQNTFPGAEATNKEAVAIINTDYPGLNLDEKTDYAIRFRANEYIQSTTETSFIRFGTFLKLIEKIVGISDLDKASHYIKLAYNSGAEYNTFPDHSCADPNVGLLPFIPRTKDLFLPGNLNIDTFLQPEKEANKIMNIWLNINSLVIIIHEHLKQNTPQVNPSIKSVLESVLAHLQISLGGINDFQIHYDERQRTFYIVDRRFSPSVDEFKRTVIDVVGLKSLVTNINLTSSITSAIANTIAISAAANESDPTVEASRMFQWNHGLRSRFKTKSANGSNNTITRAKEPTLAELRQAVIDAVGVYKNASTLDAQAGSSLLATHSNYTKKAYEALVNSGNQAPAGALPFDIDLTIEGIGGIHIAQGFVVGPGLLPASQEGKIGFIVTGISHSIENNKWLTHIKGQTMLLQATKIGKHVGKKLGEIIPITDFSAPPLLLQAGPAGKGVSLFINSNSPGTKLAAEFIPTFEGFIDYAKLDQDRPRLGHGTQQAYVTGKNGVREYRTVQYGDTITRADARLSLERNIQEIFVPQIKRDLGAELYDKLPAQSQAALISLSYNFGHIPSNTASLIKKGDYEGACRLWRTQGIRGKVDRKLYPKLVERRIAETELFLSKIIATPDDLLNKVVLK